MTNNFNPKQFYNSIPLEAPHNAVGDALLGTGIGGGIGAGAGALIPLLFSKLTKNPIDDAIFNPGVTAAIGGGLGGALGLGIGGMHGVNQASQVGNRNADRIYTAANTLSPEDMAALYEYLLYTPQNQIQQRTY